MNRQSDSTCILGNDGTVLECVVDAINRVVLHSQQEARRHLRHGCSSIEESRSGMSEVFVGQEIIGFNDSGNIITMNANSDTHEHVLGALGNLSVHLEEIRLFQGLESKVLKVEITIVNDSSIEFILVFHSDLVGLLAYKGGRKPSLGVLVVVEFLNVLRESLGCLLVKIGDGDTSSKNRIIRVLGGERGCSLCGKSVETRFKPKTRKMMFQRQYGSESDPTLTKTYSSSSDVVTPG